VAAAPNGPLRKQEQGYDHGWERAFEHILDQAERERSVPVMNIFPVLRGRRLFGPSME